MWRWAHRPADKNKRPIPELRDIPVNDGDVIIGDDSDVSRNRAVRKAVTALAEYLTRQRRSGEGAVAACDGDGKTAASSRRHCGASSS